MTRHNPAHHRVYRYGRILKVRLYMTRGRRLYRRTAYTEFLHTGRYEAAKGNI